MHRHLILLAAAVFVVFVLAVACGGGDDQSPDDAGGDDEETGFEGRYDDADPPGDDDDDGGGNDDRSPREKLEDLFDEMGFLPYLGFEPVRTEELENGFTRYFYSTDDFRCYDGGEANVAVSPGTSDNVIFYMEGGGARWPGFFLGIEIDNPGHYGLMSGKEANPLRDWNVVYVPYCDNSVHAGDNEYEEAGWTVYHHGLRHTAAAAALSKELVPEPGKVLVTGVSAGGFGTFAGWPIVKSVYMDTDTYVLNDSGIGVWNPDRPDTFEAMKNAWNLPIPDACERCQEGTVLTWVVELAMEYDPQVRVGLSSFYRDFVIANLFLRMNAADYEALILDVTGQIEADYPDRGARFFVEGRGHTFFMMDGGPNYEVDGISLYEWIGWLVNEDPRWDDVLE